MVTLSPDEAVDELHEQASSCRRLARNSRTDLGSAALLAAANQFESDAFHLVGKGEGRLDGQEDARGRLRDALAWQEALWLQMRPGAVRTANYFRVGDLDG